MDIKVIWAFGKPEYFFKRGWTTKLMDGLICPSGTSASHFRSTPRTGHLRRRLAGPKGAMKTWSLVRKFGLTEAAYLTRSPSSLPVEL
jgi:hypothetical protein